MKPIETYLGHDLYDDYCSGQGPLAGYKPRDYERVGGSSYAPTYSFGQTAAVTFFHDSTRTE